MIDPLYKLKKVAEEQKDALKDMLASGAAKDFNDYSRGVGAIMSFDLILTEIDDLERRMAEE